VLALVLLGTVLIVAMRISDYVAAVIFVHATRNVTELSVLIGNAWEISYVIQLALGLWITPWLLAKAGVKNAILTLPILTLLGFAFVALAPALLASLFLFVVRNGIQTGVDDPAENVLGGALPNQVGPKLKVLLDTLVLPGAAAIAGIGLLVVQSIFRSTSVVFLAVVGAVVTLAFVGAALWVRSLYVSAIYQRLRSHTLSLSDLELALGRPSPAEVSSLVANIDDESEEVREFAAAALARLSPPAFLKQLPRLAAAADPRLRRVAYQMAPPGGLDRTLIERGAADADPWVIAAAAVAGGRLRPRWERWEEVLAALRAAEDPESQAASAWAAALVGDRAAVAHAMMAASAKVRLEALRSFAKLKGDVPTAARPLIRCLGDPSVDVRREALRQAARWTPPPGYAEDFAAILVENLKATDPLTRRLAGQAIAAQAPNALRDAVPLLEGELRSAVATVEALVRSAREDHVEHALSRVEETLGEALDSAGLAARLEGLAKVAGPTSEDARFALLRTALEDYVRRAVELALAALRALHEKRGFVRVERGLRSDDSTARVEAVETLLNFGPARLAGPLAELLDAENFEVAAPRPLDETELEKLAQHPDAWVRRAVAALSGGDDGMKDLIALKKVPLFADLTLEQLASIDRLMVTRHYLPGETIFRWGDVSSELYVVLEGEVRIHRDNHDGEVTLARLGPSSVMGEMAPFTDQPRSAGAVAVVETTCRVLRKDRLETILHEHPEVLLEVIRNLSQRLTVANEQLEAAARAGQAGVGTRRAPRRRKEPAAAH
jgi:CRP-like cAMP-binding protein